MDNDGDDDDDDDDDDDEGTLKDVGQISHYVNF